MPSVATTEQLLAHTAWLTRVARALTTSAEDAEEIVQQTWLQALERPPSHADNLRGWLATIARNLVKLKRRTSERERARVQALPRTEPGSAPDDAVARAELQQVVLDAVLSLAEPYRSTLVLRFLDEWTADEIAKRSGDPVETVRTRIKRGLDQVRARVAQKLGAEREQLPAMLAPLLAAGVVAVTSTTKVGLLIGAAAAVLATTFVLTRAGVEGDARGDESAVRSFAPATAAAAAKETTVPPAVATREAEPATKKVTPKPISTTFDLVGTVVDANGTPVADAMVALFDSDSRQVADTNQFVMAFLEPLNGGQSIADELIRTTAAVRTTVTDIHGAFTLDRLARARRCRVGAFHTTSGCTELIEVAPPTDSDSRRVTLPLLAGIVVHGRVIDADGHPAPGSSISFSIERAGCTRSSAMFDGPHTNGIIAGPDATFSIPPVPADVLTLCATDAACRHRSEWVRLRADDGVASHDVTLRLASAPFCIELHGRVLGPDRQPLVASHPFMRSMAEWEKATHGLRAFYVWPIHGDVPKVGDVLPQLIIGSTNFNERVGDYLSRAPLDEEFIPNCIAVVARDRVLAVEPLDEEPLRAADGVFEVPDLVIESLGGPLQPKHAALLVRVLDEATQGPLDGTPTITYLQRADNGASGKMINDGVQAEPQIVPPGRCAVIVTCRGYVGDWAAGDYAARAEPYIITLVLRRAVRAVRGIVVDSEQRPVAKARLFWLCEDGSQMRASAFDPVTTDADGRFEFEAVAATRGRLAVEAESFVPTFIDVAAGNDDASSKIELKRGVAVTFTCAATPDRRTPGGNLTILRDDGAILREDWNAPFSRLNTNWPKPVTLPPGKYRYRVDFVSRADDEGEFVASDGAEIVVTPRAR